MKNDRFVVSALVDFPDDCGNIVFTRALVENLIERLQSVGVTRVYWNFYQAGMWEFFGAGSEATRETLRNLGEPVAVGARAARERGMEFWATIKPYETGASHSNPGNSPQMLEYPGLPGIGGEYNVDPWVLNHPEMRLKIRSADLPQGLETVPAWTWPTRATSPPAGSARAPPGTGSSPSPGGATSTCPARSARPTRK